MSVGAIFSVRKYVKIWAVATTPLLILIATTPPVSCQHIFTLIEPVTKNIDIDECAFGLDNCHDNAYCTNVEDGFTCTCETGYTGDGTNCASMHGTQKIHYT